eukprot:CAMPEP_0203662180 /NCGR_PEP_ID=MMETSP0090-20130426/232_1 /ASSEMBLY_ACC=CAM_ASM_001088 /TAXON_ID=426623 /ORGANISM="Chaetoceros affinis, Strain CCMP159" /LENGTH=540 /DNA_ID=CAMNT_0050524933 /DNA_START=167 /DNA_END=1786 /DNA_ORIENTATION=-
METTPTNLQVLDLPTSTLAERTAHAELLLELEAKKVAATLDVPTLSHQVRDNLRSIGEPVRLFGENNANVRDRLRLCLAKIEIRKRGAVSGDGVAESEKDEKEAKLTKEDDEAVETKYTYATEELVKAREFIAAYSLGNAQNRLGMERKRRWGANKRSLKRRVLVDYNDNSGHDEDHGFIEEEVVKELDDMDSNFLERQKTLRNMALEGSQYGDPRPLSAISTLRKNSSLSSDTARSIIVTGGWSGSIKLWDGSSPALDLLSTKNMAHEDRIVGVDIQPDFIQDSTDYIVASASIDLMGKLWKVSKDEDTPMQDPDSGEEKCQDNRFVFEEAAVLKGHQARLCNVAFHPSGRYVGTTSFDHTWRLWDIESGGKELLLQDGHWKEVYGIAFHTDGSLCSTTDFGSVVQLWDLRTGKSACHFLGHAKRVLCTQFSPNGFQLCTAGDDGTIKIWDLRSRKQYASIPAHSKLITQINFAHNCGHQNGEYLTSSSFDGTGKVWSTRDWKLISTLRGHEGKVMGIDVLPSDDGIVTCGYDKTLKIW